MFGAEDMAGRVADKGDLFEPMLTLKQSLPALN